MEEDQRMFSYEWMGSCKWVGIPYDAELTLPDGRKLRADKFEDGQQGWGNLISPEGEVRQFLFTCVEP